MAEAAAPRVISGIEAMRGVGAQQARGFWADAWSRVWASLPARVAIGWVVVMGIGAVVGPLLANAHPLWMQQLDSNGAVVSSGSPLWRSLSAADLLLLLAPLLALWVALPLRRPRGERLGAAAAMGILALVVVIAGASAADWLDSPARTGALREFDRWINEPGFWWRRSLPVLVIGALPALAGMLIPFGPRAGGRAVAMIAALVVSSLAVGARWTERPANYDAYLAAEADGTARTWYTLVPWSPNRVRSELISVPPMTTVSGAVQMKLVALEQEAARLSRDAAAARAAGQEDLARRKLDDEVQATRQRDQLAREWAAVADTAFARRYFILGTDPNGVDVFCQLLWACRLSISVGFVSTGIAVLIGVTLGAVMGYFGGWLDLILFRVVEIFMSIPVLFLLIVAAGVLPRNTYVMMAIIGCVSWTGAARFTRAEFMKLRSLDFVQGARAAGLPLRSVLFRHALPNGVTPVLVDTSFAVAGAILAEATLSFLGLGPDNQASWGKLLSSALATTGTFIWWLAVFPGLIIFLTVLAYNVLGGSLRDAIDPKLRKAAH